MMAADYDALNTAPTLARLAIALAEARNEY